jgi:hypothetical protein
MLLVDEAAKQAYSMAVGQDLYTMILNLREEIIGDNDGR